MGRRPSTAAWLGLVLVVAFAARLAAGAWWQERQPDEAPFFFGDSYSYWWLAQTIAHGAPYEYGMPDAAVFRTPGLPLLLAPLFLFGGDVSPLWGRAVVALAGTISVAATWWLGRLLFDDRAGLLAAAAMALYPTNVFLGGVVLTEAPFAAAMLAQLACWTIAWQRRHVLSPRWSERPLLWMALAGVAAGVATLLRPSWLLFTPLAIVVGWLLGTPRNFHLRGGAVMLLALAATMAPWWLRNAAVTGRFVPTTLQMGASLYDGWNPAATGASDMDFGPAFEARQRAAYAALPADARPPFEVYLNAQYRRAAVAWAREHPAETVELAATKFVRMWNLWPNAAEFRNLGLRLAVAATYTPLLALAALGAWRFAPQGWPYALCLAPALYLAALHLIFIGSLRYREPALMPLAVLAAGWWTSRRGATAPPTA